MTPFVPSPNLAELRESATLLVLARARALRAEGRLVIDLGAGEPDFATPPFVIEAAHRALDAGATRYTPTEGILPLREAIAARASALHEGPPRSAAEIVVTAGAKQALFNTFFTLFGPGDEVLVPTPGWTSYDAMIRLARAVPVAVRGQRARDLKVTPDDLDAAATPRTRGLVLNSPCNPTGAVYTRAELAALVAWARARGAWIVSDEIYRAFSYGETAASALSVCDSRDRLVVVDGLAKSLAMMGWRVGWSIAPEPVARRMAALQSHTTSHAATLSQHAALAALADPERASAATTQMARELRSRRDAALALLREGGADVVNPEGAFYFFLRVGEATDGDPDPGTRFARRLLEDHEVVLVPGAAFGAPEWVRVSYAAPASQVLEGVRRLLAAGWA